MQGMKTRWHQHVYAARSNRGGRGHHLGAAIRLFGVEAFAHEVLEVVATASEASEAERWWIAHFGSDQKALGYNIEHGGIQRQTVTPESQEKMRAAWTPERREALGKRRRGVSMPEETRRKSSESHRALWEAMTSEERRTRSKARAGKKWTAAERSKHEEIRRARSEARRALRALPLFEDAKKERV